MLLLDAHAPCDLPLKLIVSCSSKSVANCKEHVRTAEALWSAEEWSVIASPLLLD